MGTGEEGGCLRYLRFLGTWVDVALVCLFRFVIRSRRCWFFFPSPFSASLFRFFSSFFFGACVCIYTCVVRTGESKSAVTIDYLRQWVVGAESKCECECGVRSYWDLSFVLIDDMMWCFCTPRAPGSRRGRGRSMICGLSELILLICHHWMVWMVWMDETKTTWDMKGWIMAIRSEISQTVRVELHRCLERFHPARKKKRMVIRLYRCRLIDCRNHRDSHLGQKSSVWATRIDGFCKIGRVWGGMWIIPPPYPHPPTTSPSIP